VQRADYLSRAWSMQPTVLADFVQKASVTCSRRHPGAEQDGDMRCKFLSYPGILPCGATVHELLQAVQSQNIGRLTVTCTPYLTRTVMHSTHNPGVAEVDGSSD
jgi:hypothetical protein